MTTITWSAVLSEADAPCVTRRTTQILSVLPPTPEDAAATALKWWLEEDEPGGFGTNWDAEADDHTSLTGHVVIHEPIGFAGTYEVQLERVIQARGYRAYDSDAANIEALCPPMSTSTQEPAQ